MYTYTHKLEDNIKNTRLEKKILLTHMENNKTVMSSYGKINRQTKKKKETQDIAVE